MKEEKYYLVIYFSAEHIPLYDLHNFNYLPFINIFENNTTYK